MLDYSNGIAYWWSGVTDWFQSAVTNVWGVFSIILMLFGVFFLVVFVILLVRFLCGFDWKQDKGDDPGKEEK